MWTAQYPMSLVADKVAVCTVTWTFRLSDVRGRPVKASPPMWPLCRSSTRTYSGYCVFKHVRAFQNASGVTKRPERHETPLPFYDASERFLKRLGRFKPPIAFYDAYSVFKHVEASNSRQPDTLARAGDSLDDVEREDGPVAGEVCRCQTRLPGCPRAHLGLKWRALPSRGSARQLFRKKHESGSSMYCGTEPAADDFTHREHYQPLHRISFNT